MLTIDLILILSLAAFTALWWSYTNPQRGRHLFITSTVTLITAVIAVVSYRWQAAVGATVAALFLIFLLIGRLRGSRPRIRLPYLSGSFVALLAIAAILPIYYFPVYPLPAPSGKHFVGVRDFSVVDRSRMGINGVDENVPRRLLVRVWYPSDDITGLKSRHYFSEAEVQSTAKGVGRAMKMPFLLQHLGHAKTNSFEGAPLLSGASDLPTLIYSHGYGLYAGQNTALMEDLASHGYVIYSLHHSGDGTDAVMPNGDIVPTDPAIFETAAADAEQMESLMSELLMSVASDSWDKRRAAVLQQRNNNIERDFRPSVHSAEIWTDDQLFLHDTLESGDVAKNVVDIVAASNLQETGQFGMSFGGSVAGDVCQKDSRCAAAVNLDGGEFHYTSFNRQIPVPFLMMHSDPARAVSLWGGDEAQQNRARPFNDFAYERHDLAGLRDDLYRVQVNGADHGSYSDLKWYLRIPILNSSFGALDPKTTLAFQNDFVRGFFDKHLKNIDNLFPEPQLEAYEAIAVISDTTPLREWWTNAHPEDDIVRVVLETARGNIVLALYPKRAPVSVTNFLNYVENGHYDGAQLYRVAHDGNSPAGRALSIVQGGILSVESYLDAARSQDLPAPPLPPIHHETTTQTGILNERGVVSYGRLNVGTAASEFFVNLGDNPILDTGTDPASEAGYATFGRVISGLRLLDQIQQEETMADASDVADFDVRTQLLIAPIVINRAYVKR